MDRRQSVAGVQRGQFPGESLAAAGEDAIQQGARPREGEHVGDAGPLVLLGFPVDHRLEHAAVADVGLEPHGPDLPLKLAGLDRDVWKGVLRTAPLPREVGGKAAGEVNVRRIFHEPMIGPPHRLQRQQVIEVPCPQTAALQQAPRPRRRPCGRQRPGNRTSGRRPAGQRRPARADRERSRRSRRGLRSRRPRRRRARKPRPG